MLQEQQYRSEISVAYLNKGLPSLTRASLPPPAVFCSLLSRVTRAQVGGNIAQVLNIARH